MKEEEQKIMDGAAQPQREEAAPRQPRTKSSFRILLFRDTTASSTATTTKVKREKARTTVHTSPPAPAGVDENGVDDGAYALPALSPPPPHRRAAAAAAVVVVAGTSASP